MSIELAFSLSREGKTINEIIKSMGISRTTFYRRYSNYCDEFKKNRRSARNIKPKKKKTGEETIRLLREGKNKKEIPKILGITRQAVHSAVKNIPEYQEKWRLKRAPKWSRRKKHKTAPISSIKKRYGFMTDFELAQKYRVHRSTVNNYTRSLPKLNRPNRKIKISGENLNLLIHDYQQLYTSSSRFTSVFNLIQGYGISYAGLYKILHKNNIKPIGARGKYKS